MLPNITHRPQEHKVSRVHIRYSHAELARGRRDHLVLTVPFSITVSAVATSSAGTAMPKRAATSKLSTICIWSASSARTVGMVPGSSPRRIRSTNSPVVRPIAYQSNPQATNTSFSSALAGSAESTGTPASVATSDSALIAATTWLSVGDRLCDELDAERGGGGAHLFGEEDGVGFAGRIDVAEHGDLAQLGHERDLLRHRRAVRDAGDAGLADGQRGCQPRRNRVGDRGVNDRDLVEGRLERLGDRGGDADGDVDAVDLANLLNQWGA